MNVSDFELALSVASVDDARGLVDVIHAAFGARPALDPPATASSETPASVAATLRAGSGIYATVDGKPAGALLITPVTAELATFQRVSVHPRFQRHGVASAMVLAAQEHAAELGFERVELFARIEFADLIAYWQRRGYAVVRQAPHGVILARELPVGVHVPTPEAMRLLGERLSRLLVPGDLLVASGDLGAGKTTLTQGIGRGLGCADLVTSPTFVLCRLHQGAGGRPDLLHVDAYRLTSSAELDDLDLEARIPQAVTVVEWGAGVVEPLAESRLEVDIRGRGSERLVLLRPVGERWSESEQAALRQLAASDAAPTGPAGPAR